MSDLSRTDQLERDLTAWFSETAAPRVPDYTDDLVQLTAGFRQRPAWAFPERWIPMSVITLGRRTIRPVPWRTIGVLALIALLVAIGLVAYVGSRPRVPAPFGLAGNGLIAIGAANDIMTLDPVSGHSAVVVGGQTVDRYPVFSADGARIAFERETGANVQLFAAPITGGDPIALTGEVAATYGVVWSPDGKELAYAGDGLWIVAADGSGARRVPMAASMDGYPMWRPPTGDQLLIAGTFEGVSGSYVVNKDGTGLRLVAQTRPSEGGLAMWTPDGSHVVTAIHDDVPGGTVHHVHLVSVDPAGVVLQDRVIGPGFEREWNGYALSPDGTRVLGVVHPAGSDTGWRLGVMNISGPAEGSIVETGPTFSESDFGYGWAPDGKTITATSPRTGETWLLDADGGPGTRATWSDAAGGASWQRTAR
jgi:Tol biopolymer transport system component